MTSVISKLFEKVKLSKQRDITESKLRKFQTGGVQGKAPIDNKMRNIHLLRRRIQVF